MPRAAESAAGIIAELRAHSRTVAIAESLSGGLVIAELTSVPGASAVLRGGIVAYSTALKASLLSVPAALLAERGPVDAEVAKAMARGVRTACAVDGVPADLGIATTGVAGPDRQGGYEPGTVFLGLSSARGERSVALTLNGDRARIRQDCVAEALRELAVELDSLGE